MGERVKGTVKWFNVTKGFGFISPDDGGEDLFVHQSSIKSDGYRSLNENDAVEFEIITGDDGRTKANDVTAPGGGALSGGSRPVEGGGDPSHTLYLSVLVLVAVAFPPAARCELGFRRIAGGVFVKIQVILLSLCDEDTDLSMCWMD
ncbi:unnamed protein product [Triticum turgidum subsp. durum]|uniref:CSD domain-containing protein n=1 Tax=Triticum turgidum subsp. durum TaxID=4567 RepID=A0A9R0V922_TRITD|nr:unnamed protein product [Triticum turgidum subsp. durum]